MDRITFDLYIGVLTTKFYLQIDIQIVYVRLQLRATCDTLIMKRMRNYPRMYNIVAKC